MKGIKILGLAALTALALVAVPGVASASPGVFTAEGYPASIVGEASGTIGEKGVLNAPQFGPGKCPSPVLEGTLAGPSSTLTLPATLSENCTFASSKCEFALHPVSGSTKGTIDIVGCSSFEGAVIYPGICHVTVTPKKGIEATFENQGSGSSATIKVHINATGLEYFSTNCNPIGTVYTDGTYSATWTARGEISGKSTGVAVAPLPGFSVIGGGSAEFHSELYPATIGGEQTTGEIEGKKLKKLELVTAAGAVKCETATFKTPSSAPEGLLEDTSELLLSPTGTPICTLAGTVPVTVTPTTGCMYNYVLTGSAPYVGSLFMCETKIAVTESKCAITVANQTHSGMEYANVGSGSAETVEAKANLSGLEYQIAEGKSCPNEPANGSHSDGKYKGVIKLNVTKVG